MKRVRFSIITCTYNSADYIKKNIESVKSQLFDNYEHIFIDAYSEDETLKIIDGYKKDRPDKVKIYSQKAQGISKAMNLGIKKCKGEILIHLHSDDYLFDEKVLSDVHSEFKKNGELDWIYGKSKILEVDGRKVGVFPNRKFLQKYSKVILKYFNSIPHQSVFIKRPVFRTFGMFDEGLTSQMDWDMWLRIADKTKWKFYNRIICCYTLRPQAQSSGIKNIKENRKNLFKVAQRNLSGVELLAFKVFRLLLNYYNKTRR